MCDKKTLRAQGHSCDNLIRNIKILKETCKIKAILTRSCKIYARIMHSLERSCKTFCKNLAKILQESCKNFIFSRLGKFTVEYDWNNKISQNVQNFGFFLEKWMFFLKKKPEIFSKSVNVAIFL